MIEESTTLPPSSPICVIDEITGSCSSSSSSSSSIGSGIRRRMSSPAASKTAATTTTERHENNDAGKSSTSDDGSWTIDTKRLLINVSELPQIFQSPITSFLSTCLKSTAETKKNNCHLRPPTTTIRFTLDGRRIPDQDEIDEEERTVSTTFSKGDTWDGTKRVRFVLGGGSGSGSSPHHHQESRSATTTADDDGDATVSTWYSQENLKDFRAEAIQEMNQCCHDDVTMKYAFLDLLSMFQPENNVSATTAMEKIMLSKSSSSSSSSATITTTGNVGGTNKRRRISSGKSPTEEIERENDDTGSVSSSSSTSTSSTAKRTLIITRRQILESLTKLQRPQVRAVEDKKEGDPVQPEQQQEEVLYACSSPSFFLSHCSKVRDYRRRHVQLILSAQGKFLRDKKNNINTTSCAGGELSSMLRSLSLVSSRSARQLSLWIGQSDALLL